MGHLLFKINVNSSVHRCFKLTFYYDLHVSVMIMLNKNCTMHKALGKEISFDSTETMQHSMVVTKIHSFFGSTVK